MSNIWNVMQKIDNALKVKKLNQRCEGVAKWWVIWWGKVVSFEVTFEGVKWWWDSDSSRYMVPDLWSSRGESTTSKIGFYAGNMKEKKARGTM